MIKIVTDEWLYCLLLCIAIGCSNTTNSIPNSNRYWNEHIVAQIKLNSGSYSVIKCLSDIQNQYEKLSQNKIRIHLSGTIEKLFTNVKYVGAIPNGGFFHILYDISSANGVLCQIDKDDIYFCYPDNDLLNTPGIFYSRGDESVSEGFWLDNRRFQSVTVLLEYMHSNGITKVFRFQDRSKTYPPTWEADVAQLVNNGITVILGKHPITSNWTYEQSSSSSASGTKTHPTD